MKSKLLLVTLVGLLISSLVLAGCTTETTPTPKATPAGPTPTSAGPANWWDDSGEPQYGGTITLRVTETASFQFDPYGPPYMSGISLQMWHDTLFSRDWTVDRSIWPFKTEFMPDEYAVGSLAESWEQTDPQTVVVHLRQGVHWQDKPPVDGREFTADDVVFHYNRVAGTGNGFSVPSAFWSYWTTKFESATANDKYTVTIKFKKANAINFAYFVDPFQYNYIEPAEWVALAGPPPTPEPGPPDGGAPPPPPPGSAVRDTGPLNDWRNAVGLGPWILTDFVDGGSMNFDKNPNYFGYDERYPQNRLPYADKLTVVVIPDNATALAALRTGKIDIMDDVQWQQSAITAKNNPELLQAELPTSGYGMLLNLNLEPFNDINVRKAMQLAIDRPLIAKTHYGGIVDGVPCSRISPSLEGYAFTYDEWPQQLKDEYSYNPTKAKELLAAAGYPDGFKTTCRTVTSYDMELLQIIQAMFKDIGITMDISSMEMGSYTQFIMTAKHEMAGPEPNGYGTIGMPWQSLLGLTTFFINPSTVNDPHYDQMCLALEDISDPAELKQRIKEADRYIAEQHWSIWLFPIVTYNIYQPYLKGYSGEQLNCMGYYSRWWIDQEQKKSMGR